MGRHEVGFVENTVKTPLGDEGCLFEAKFHVNKIPGNFHLSTHSVDVQPDRYDFAHEIHEISFGSKIKKISSKNFRSSFNPLKDRSKLDGSNLESHEYVMKVVLTPQDDISGNTEHIRLQESALIWTRRTDHTCAVVWAEPDNSQISSRSNLPFPDHHLCHCRRNVHCGQHHRLVHLQEV